MELPLDHFRLIGVSPSATAEEILRAFQLRLDKTPDEGFTYEVLAQRSELLRLTADLLTNAESRKNYEDLVLNGASGLEFSSNREVAGLILLWESGSPKEAFKLTRKALQPPQTPALGSSRELDLTLLAALTSRDSAIKEQEQRCYSNAADFLQEGIQILQRMGKMSELRQNLEDDLSALLPYRILDLLSRDLSDTETHKKGILMLFNYICKRGGIEGNDKFEKDEILDQNNFEAFFEQVKSFLTVQEQIDLFLNLQKRGSKEAGFLAFSALVAKGFAKRKPEKLFEAQKILKNLNISELDIMPIIGCIDLLLANVDKAEERFFGSTDNNLKEWLDSYEGENLDAICLYCKNWLENEILKGYRDIAIDEVDLDSWFEDRVIQEFIEKEEKKSNKVVSGAYIQRLGNNLKKIIDESNDKVGQNNDINESSKLPLPGGYKKDTKNYYSESFSEKELIFNKFIKIFKKMNERYAELKFFIGDSLKNNKIANNSTYYIYLNVFLILFFFGIALGFIRNNSKNEIDKNSSPLSLTKENNNQDSNKEDYENLLTIKNEYQIKKKENIKQNRLSPIVPLSSNAPTLNQIESLLNNWLQNKSTFLAGNGQINLDQIVQKNLIDRLNEERANDLKRNTIKIIDTEIQSIEYLTQSPSRISVLAKLKYSEKILDKNGDVVNKTTFTPFLNVKYILGYTNSSWKLVDYVSGM